MESSYSSHFFAHGPDTSVRAHRLAPILSIASDARTFIAMSPADSGELAGHHLSFAKDLAAAAEAYGDQLADWVGDPQAGADFWASIATCPGEGRHKAAGR